MPNITHSGKKTRTEAFIFVVREVFSSQNCIYLRLFGAIANLRKLIGNYGLLSFVVTLEIGFQNNLRWEYQHSFAG